MKTGMVIFLIVVFSVTASLTLAFEIDRGSNLIGVISALYSGFGLGICVRILLERGRL